MTEGPDSKADASQGLEALRARVLELENQLAERDLAEEKLRQAKEDAEHSSKIAREFLASMSHEIRTPMTAIIGFGENLMEPNLSPEERLKAVQTILQSGTYLLNIINNILEFSKIEAGKIQLECIPCSTPGMLTHVQSLMEPHAKEKGLRFQLTCVNKVPETIQGDPTRIQQILINLLGNAIKFTKEGTILLLVSFREDDDAQGVLDFNIMDSGIGMTEEQLDRLFVPFQQADASTARNFGGSGLGLTICKRLATLLGGDIFVASQPERGSLFRVTIPTGDITGVKMTDDLQSVRVETKNPAASGVEIHGKVLLAEDTKVNQILIARLLQKAGADVSVCENGQEAVELAMAACAAGDPFAVILMDMQMPVLDGYGATRLLRKQGYTLPIIALTASVMPADRSECLQAGCDDFSSKPVDRKKLFQQIRNLIGPAVPA